ncbi:hypothetical protein [Couchioplanes azureus]|uniref:hypothetical protein n=1 Tax=Couchioplanes caeruleus TaxID=56438 RepID=UPI0016712751|nr:hypothetical protein [Couchioplanes caeruleus]GGQ41628.1 hypothetical protein GCM10010166_06510 [Couchioplanes caeruleus subsp. azureus]
MEPPRATERPTAPPCATGPTSEPRAAEPPLEPRANESTTGPRANESTTGPRAIKLPLEPHATEPAMEPPQVAGPPAEAVSTTRHSGEAAEAHRAGVQDATAALERPAESADAGKAAERDHDEIDAGRFNTEGTVAAYQPRRSADQEPTIVDLLAAVPASEPAAAAVPDVMILPEPERDRPTVALDRGPVPGQGTPGKARDDQARADRALQDRVRAERTSALLETSPFWLSDDQRPAPPARDPRPSAGRPPRRKPRDPRRPVSGLLALLALALVATFFSWVSAEPFWLAVGHGHAGTATIARCTGDGVTQRCSGQFTSADGRYTVPTIALFGVEPAQRATGSVASARMVSQDSRQAYAGEASVLVHLRWSLGFVLVLLCGLGIAGLTGARRLGTARSRRGALLLSLAGPLALLAGFLLAAY